MKLTTLIGLISNDVVNVEDCDVDDNLLDAFCSGRNTGKISTNLRKDTEQWYNSDKKDYQKMLNCKNEIDKFLQCLDDIGINKYNDIYSLIQNDLRTIVNKMIDKEKSNNA